LTLENFQLDEEKCINSCLEGQEPLAGSMGSEYIQARFDRECQAGYREKQDFDYRKGKALTKLSYEIAKMTFCRPEVLALAPGLSALGAEAPGTSNYSVKNGLVVFSRQHLPTSSIDQIQNGTSRMGTC